MKQISYCYVAQLIGPAGQPNFTEKELHEDFAVVWAKDTAEAIDLLQRDAPKITPARLSANETDVSRSCSH